MLTPTLRLIRPLGEGGMGCVWLAEHTSLQCQVAVKFLHEKLAREVVAHERFRLEAAAAARVRSAHVVQVLDHGYTDDGLPYIAMELLEGETVQERVEREGPLDFELTMEIARQAGRALAKAHDLGIVHRDVKPDNLFLISGDADPFVKILDFGIARQLDRVGINITSTGNVVGTPHFMAPEQMAGTAVLPASDVWSLGIVIYYCLTGRLPYEGPSLAALALAIDRECPVRVSSLVPQVPAGFDAWLGRALAPSHEARFADAREMLDALERHVLAPDAVPMAEDPHGAEWQDAGMVPMPHSAGGRFPTPGRMTPASSSPRRSWVPARPRRWWGHAAIAMAACLGVFALGFFGILQAATRRAEPDAPPSASAPPIMRSVLTEQRSLAAPALTGRPAEAAPQATSKPETTAARSPARDVRARGYSVPPAARTTAPRARPGRRDLGF